MGRPPGSRNKGTNETSTELAVVEPASQGKMMLLDYMADKYSLNPDEFSRTVRAVCGMPAATPEQFAAFLLVAKTYDLNPLIKEIYAFPGKGGGIVPIVSIDGWVNLVNSHPACDGFEFEMEHDDNGNLVACTCLMYRKDRSKPVNITEYLSECKRPTDPWKMEHRMLRHKSMIQAARYAFGFAGIYDPDEGEKIAVGGAVPGDAGPPRTINAEPAKQIEHQPDPEQPRDGTPPRRTSKPSEPKKDDPITSGPPRTTQEKPPAGEFKKDHGPKDHPPEPFRVPGTGHTFETWADQYIDLLKTSPDTAAVYGWIDRNTKPFSPGEGQPMQPGPLDRLSKGKPSVYAKVKKATEDTMQALRDAQQKAADKAAKKAAPAPTEMDGPPAGEMDDTKAGADLGGDTGHGFGPPENPEDVLKFIETTLAAVTEPEDLENIWVEQCEPKLEGMFPPDQDEANGIYRKHEKRLAP